MVAKKRVSDGRPKRVRDRLAGRGLSISVFALAVLLAILNGIWLVVNRRGGALNIDEAGYLSVAVSDYDVLRHRGIVGLARFVLTQPVQPPLVPLLSSGTYVLTGGPTILGSYAVQLAAYAGIAWLSYALARHLSGRGAGVLAALLVASTPIALNYVHTYSFALPAAAMFTAAVYAGIRSRQMTELRWASVWGLGLGAMVMCRTMTIAFLPAFALLAIIQVLTSSQRRRSAAGLGLGIAIGILVAGPWYVAQGGSVLHYLTTYGYGAQSALYGPATSQLSAADWRHFVLVNVNEYLWLPIATVLLLGALKLVGDAVSRLASAGGISLADIARSPWFYLVVVTAEGIVALESSRNSGSGFLGPLVPCIVVISVAGIFHRIVRRRIIMVAVAGIVIVATPSWVSKMALNGPARTPVVVTVPGLGPTFVIDGRSTFDAYQGDEADARDPNATRWVEAWHDLASKLQTLARGDRQFNVIFAFNNLLINVNAFKLEELLSGGTGVSPTLLSSAAGNSQSVYAERLSAVDHSLPTFLLLTDTSRGEIPPFIDQSAVAAAATVEGFHPSASFLLPDGSVIRIWSR